MRSEFFLGIQLSPFHPFLHVLDHPGPWPEPCTWQPCPLEIYSVYNTPLVVRCAIHAIDLQSHFKPRL